MKPAPFDYIACQDIAEATACLKQYGDDARILAGGQSLIAMLNMRLAEPQVLADISQTPALSAIKSDHFSLRPGAAVTQSAVLNWPGLRHHVPLLALALPHTGHFQTRNKGTICGSLAHADPSSELPLVACVLEASITLASAGSTRTLAASAFFTGLLQTARRPEELVTSAAFPACKPGEAFAFRETAMRHGDFAIAAVAVKVTHEAITIGIGGGPERPVTRKWPMLDGGALDDALNALAWDMDFQDDTQAPASYRRRIVRLQGRQAIEEARACLA